MKNYSIQSILITAIIALLPISLWAQHDDLYYNPDDFQTTTFRNNVYSDSDISFGEQEYDSQYFDDYDFYYTSRIRRFHRAARGIDFYDPFFVDLVYYGYHSPGVTIYVSPYRFRPYRPHAFSYYHWHHHDPFFNPYHSWHNPWRPYRPYGSFHSYGFGFGYGYSSWGSFGYRGCPIFYTSNNFYVNNYYTTRPGSSTQRPSDDIRSRRGTQYGPGGATGGAAPRSGRSVAGTGSSDEGVRDEPTSDERSTSTRGRIAQSENDERLDTRERSIDSEQGARTSEERSTSTSDRITRSDNDERIDTRGRTIDGQRDSRTSEDRAPSREGITEQTTRGRTSGSDFAGVSRSNERMTAGREAQRNFRDNRVTRDQYQSDRRSNVPQRANNTDRSTSQQRSPAFNDRSQQRTTPPHMRENQGRTNQPSQRGIDQNRQRQQNPPNMNNNRSNQRTSPPNMNNNRSSNQRGSGVNPSSRGNQRSPSVTPPSRNNRSSSGTNTGRSSRSSGSDSPRSSRSGRGG